MPETTPSLRSNTEPTKSATTEAATTNGTATKNGRGDRRRKWEMTPADVRFFLPKPGTSAERPELGREMDSESAILLEAFRTGQTFFTVVAWKAVPDMEDDVPRIVKEALKRT